MPPMPPADLRFKVAGAADEAQFDASGRQSAADFARALAGVGRSMAEFPRILEWGCGCGRILRHLPAEGHELHGCDIDAEAIGWLRQNIPAFQVVASEGLPPLPYPDGHFDLIVNHSVLSHLDEAYQNAWLAELGRILSPEGVLILTVHGDYAYRAWAASVPPDELHSALLVGASRRALDRRGFFFLDSGGWSKHFPAYYQNTFHRPGYVFEHWARFFDILSYTPQGSLNHQDMVVMRRRRPTTHDPVAPGPARMAALRMKSARRFAGLVARAVRRRLLLARPT